MVLQEGLLCGQAYIISTTKSFLEGIQNSLLTELMVRAQHLNWCIKMSVQDTKTLVSSFEVFHFRHALIEVNFVADVYC